MDHSLLIYIRKRKNRSINSHLTHSSLIHCNIGHFFQKQSSAFVQLRFRAFFKIKWTYHRNQRKSTNILTNTENTSETNELQDFKIVGYYVKEAVFVVLLQYQVELVDFVLKITTTKDYQLFFCQATFAC